MRCSAPTHTDRGATRFLRAGATRAGRLALACPALRRVLLLRGLSLAVTARRAASRNFVPGIASALPAGTAANCAVGDSTAPSATRATEGAFTGPAIAGTACAFAIPNRPRNALATDDHKLLDHDMTLALGGLISYAPKVAGHGKERLNSCGEMIPQAPIAALTPRSVRQGSRPSAERSCGRGTPRTAR